LDARGEESFRAIFAAQTRLAPVREFSTSQQCRGASQLVSLGVDSTRLDAKGYGADHPVGDNSTIDGRQANRRIALRVTQK